MTYFFDLYKVLYCILYVCQRTLLTLSVFLYYSDLLFKREVWTLSGSTYTIKNPARKTLFMDTLAKFDNFGDCILLHLTGS